MKVTVSVWDFPIRIFHWSLVVAIVAAYITADLGGLWMDWHGRIGLFILGLLVFRLAWGFFGSTHARFASFFPTVGRLKAYIKGQWQGLGHNPLGALSVLALLALLGLQVVTGLFANDDITYEGPLTVLIDKPASDNLTRWHNTLFDGLLWLVGLHVASIFYYRWVKKHDLLKPMLTGKKIVPPEQVVAVEMAGPLRLALSLLLTVTVVWTVAGSPLLNVQAAPVSEPSPATLDF
ncbi:MAG: cytochrome b/b6 domain-containing protein [Methylococcales bacterium]|nr:cytochrome b/b6 domain-containing protein [Methylococcales bacterium]